MKPYRWFSKRLISGVLVSAMLVMIGSSPMVSASSPPETEWEKTFGGSGYEFAQSLDQTTDGGYIIVGVTESYGAGLYDVYLVKTDASGNMEWEKTFGGSGYDSGRSVKQTIDGGYIIVGETYSYGVGGDIYLVKTDASGNMEWEKTFGGIEHESGLSVQQTTDGGYIIAGSTTSYGEGGDVYLVKTNASGNMEWEKTFGGTNEEYASSVMQTADGGYIFVGGSSNPSVNDFNIYIVKADSSGNMEWEKIIDRGSFDDGMSVQQTGDNGYIIAGDTGTPDEDGDAYLIKTDTSGNVEWEKIIGGSDADCFYAVEQTTDGGYIAAGDTLSYGVGGDIYLVKVGPEIDNTPAGSNVTVNLESGTVTFPTVSGSGTTTMTTLTENPVDPTPSDFYVIEGSFFEITTTATYNGTITVGLAYDELQVGNEAGLRLFHWNGSVWEDVTTSVDTANNIVYGQVTGLSPFFIGEPAALPVANAGGPYLAQVNCSVNLDGGASYHPDGTIVSYDWSFGDSTTGNGVLVSHTYTAVGIYEVNLTVTDDRGAQSTGTTMAVVYDPATGSATGGGWFWSAKGNLKRDLESEGKATFGFVVKYQQEVAAGNLEFQYRAGDINLKSTDMTWLVVSGANAQFEGEGTINGDGLYTFRVLAMDGDKAGGQPDEFTIRIWLGTDTEADPIYQAIHAQLGGGNIIIHTN